MPIDMTLATQAPPKKAAPGTANKKATATRAAAVPETRSQNERRTEGLMGLGQLAQGICLMTGQYADAAAIGQHFNPIAKEVANIADTSDAIAKPIDFLIEIGPYGALIAAATPLILQLMANHGAIDASRVMAQGVVPPGVLEAQMKAQMAQMQTEAMQLQQAAMAQARQASAEYEEMMAEYAKQSA